MTDKEKAKAYDEALEKARKRVATEPQDHTDEILKDIFPELRESEDERIRRWLYDYISNCPNDNFTFYGGVGKDAVLNYLEKQKEQNLIMAKSPQLKEQKQEWSEEDEMMLASIISTLKLTNGAAQMKIDWLKSRLPVKHEWSEEDEKLFWGFTAWVPNEELERLGVTRDDLLKKLKSLRPPQDRCKDCPHRGDMFLLTQGVKSGKHELAIKFMNHLDENRPEGKMSLSNSECEDIDKAFKENDWAKIMRYYEKYRPSWKPSEEQMNALKEASASWLNEKLGNAELLKSLHKDLGKLCKKDEKI